MEAILNVIGYLNDNIVWGLPMVILMLGTGIFLTVLTKGVIFTKFHIVMRYTTKTLFRKVDKSKLEEGAITPFQAVCTALAATVGTGNIVGVALAIATGGPGAVFWLWISALVGMVIKYCEVTVSMAYRTTNERASWSAAPCTTSPEAWARSGWPFCLPFWAVLRPWASAPPSKQTPWPAA